MAITSFQHKGLEKLFVDGDGSKLNQQQIRRITLILISLDTLKRVPEDLKNLKQYAPHKLKGNLAEFWSITVTGNYRIIFKFDSDTQSITHIDLVDYH